MSSLLALALAAALTLTGQVLDAATDKPVAGAVVRAEGENASTPCLSARDGRFSCEPSAPPTALSVSHADYQTLTQAPFAPGSGPLVVRLVPKVLPAEEVEIETTFEALKPSMLQQDPFVFPLSLKRAWAGKRVERLHRVCVRRDGSIATVTRVSRETNDLDEMIQEGIRTGWRYRPLPRPACFTWRVLLHFDGGRQRHRDLLPGARPE